ncbi:MAG: DNA-entry nuclease [Streptococcus sp.]|nr:DNA-entry nuclease [Streptococcus sp.]
MKKNFSMSEKEILDLIHISIEQLTKLVGGKVQYCTNIAGKQNESNYFVVNDDIATLYLMSKDKSGYIVPHSLELAKRPKGAIFYINKNEYKDIKTKKSLMDKKNRPSLGNPAGWDKINRIKDYDRYFHRGHIIAYSLGGDKEIHGHPYKALKSLFTQTAWSNMGKATNKNGFENKFSQWDFEEKIVDELEQNSVCIACRPIYRNKADKIPIGIHMQAVTEKESLFNVFIPNIDPNIKINYKNCTFKLNK